MLVYTIAEASSLGDSSLPSGPVGLELKPANELAAQHHIRVVTQAYGA
jgi:hypothetical protein